MRSTRPLHVLALSLLLASPALAGGGPKRKSVGDYALKREFAPISAEDTALKAVPFAPGAPAVVLFEALQSEYVGEFWLLEFQRRVKILTEAGVEDFADYSRQYYGDWRIKEVQARTVLPDGTVVDATNDIHRAESKEDEVQTIDVTFPRVQVGAILDFRVSFSANRVDTAPWQVQESIPELESRYVLIPSPSFEHRAVVMHLPPESAKPIEGPYKQGRAYAWIFENQPPIPDVPYRPPTADMAAQLILAQTEYGSGLVRIDLASGWGAYGKSCHDRLRSWLAGKSSQVDTFAAGIKPADPGVLAFAEAVRVALRDRVRVTRTLDWWSRDTPDQVLEKGSGTSADLAALTVAILKARGVDATLAAFRRRSSGSLPPTTALPALLDDVLVMLPGAGEGGADVFYQPGAEEPVGALPWAVTGVLVVPYTKKCEGPVAIKDAPSADWLVERLTDLRLDLDGNATATLVETRHRMAAQARRRSFSGLTEAARLEAVQAEIRDLVPSATVTKLEVTGLEAGAASEVVVTAEVTATGVASRAGDRLVLSPFVTNRVDAADWAAETRTVPVEFSVNSDLRDEVRVHLPAGLGSVKLPQSQTMDAGAVGLYETTYAGKDATLVALRRLRLDMHLFPAEQYPVLRKWHLDMAAADDQAIVMTLAP